jgi:hypothetical protein
MSFNGLTIWGAVLLALVREPGFSVENNNMNWFRELQNTVINSGALYATTCCRTFFENSYSVKKFLIFKQLKVSLACSQNLTLVAYPELPESSPHNVSLKSILILSSNLWLDLPYGSFLWGFLTNILYEHLKSFMPCPSHPPWHNPVTVLWVQIMNLLIMRFSLPSCHFLIGPNIVLCPVLRHPQSVFPLKRDQVSHLYTITVHSVCHYGVVLTHICYFTYFFYCEAWNGMTCY